MLYRISVAERGVTGIANIFRSRLSTLDDLLRAGTVPLMSLLTSRWKPRINWQKTLFLMIASTNSTRAAAGKSLFRAKCRFLKGSVLVAKKMNSGRACCSSGRVFSMLSQWRTRARADGPPSVAVC